VGVSIKIKLFLVEPLAGLVRLPLQVALTAGLAEDALSLAQELSLPLVTAGEGLVWCLGGAGLTGRWLGAWQA
jgi:hypothetical protein